MAHAPVLLLISLAISVGPVVGFSGGSMTFTPGNRYPDGTVEIHIYYRESSIADCVLHTQWVCESENCGVLTKTPPVVTDQDHSDQNLWCQSEGHITTNVTDNNPFILNGYGCCWEDNVNAVSELMVRSRVDAGRRSDTQSPNRSPISAAVSNIRVPQNCFQNLHLLAHDPDGDNVRCNSSSLHQHPNIYIDEDLCTLTRRGPLALGLHVFELMLEDYPVSDITVTDRTGIPSVRHIFNLTAHSNSVPLSRVPLQFGVEILPPVLSCVPGVNRPRFMTPTPLHGDVHYAAVGLVHMISLRAQSSDNSVFDFQVSGPWNMSKTLRNESHGVAVATLTWTPQERDLHRHVPVCFTAETLYSQSEMRCIVMIVAKSRVLSGEADVLCQDNKISIVVSKASMKGIDQNWLQLRDPTCSLTANETHIMGTTSLNACGTTVEDSGDFLVFKNEINSYEKPNAVITRRNEVKIGFSCQYPKVATVSSHYINHKSDYIFTESSFGTFSYSFEFFNDNNFSRQVDPTQYPVQVKLTQMLYLGIEAHSALPEVRLFVESCRATPDDNPYSAVYYDIIKDGCVMDNTVEVYSSDSTKFDFGFQAFKFTGGYDEVYISCSVILCAEGSSNTRCAQGCIREPTRKRKRDLKQETARHYITQGPLSVLKESHDSAAENGGSLHISASTGVFAGLYVVSLVMLVGLLEYQAKKTRAHHVSIIQLLT